MDVPKATTAEILIDGEEIAGRMVRPWTITKCAKLTPVFEQIAGQLKVRKLSFRDFFNVQKNAEGQQTIEVLNLDQLMFTIMPVVPEVLKITLDLDDAEVDKIKQDDVMKFLVVIMQQNVDYIKNLFALMTAMLDMVKKATL